MSTERSTAALREDAHAIIRAAIAAVQPAALFARAESSLPDEMREGAAVLAIGKAADAMHDAVLEHRLVRVRRALIVAAGDSPAPTRAPGRVVRVTGSHPLPDSTSENAARTVTDWLRKLPDGLPLLVLLSGGASALIAQPAGAIAVDELAHTTWLLLRAGAPIDELNAVRRAIDRTKGGGLAACAGARAMVVLVISDVIGDRFDVIGSGPFHHATASPEQALAVLRRRGIFESVPHSVRQHLERARAGDPLPAPTAARAGNVPHGVMGNNAVAIDAAARAARERGYLVDRMARALCGEAREVGDWLAARIFSAGSRGHAPQCIAAGGETTVTVRGAGRGGRNQELALAAALRIAGDAGVVVASIGTDGRDGPTDAAGAIVDGGSVARMAAAGIDARQALERNDSYMALDAAGDLVRTGWTGTNVGDVQLVLGSMASARQPTGGRPGE